MDNYFYSYSFNRSSTPRLKLLSKQRLDGPFFQLTEDNRICIAQSEGAITIYKMTANFEYIPQHKTFTNFKAFSPNSFHLSNEQLFGVPCSSLNKIQRLKPANIHYKADTYLGHSNMIKCVVYSARHNAVYSGGYDRSIVKWTPAREVFLHLFENVHSAPINCLALTKKQHMVFSGSWDMKVKVFCVERDEQLFSFALPFPVNSLTVLDHSFYAGGTGCREIYRFTFFKFGLDINGVRSGAGRRIKSSRRLPKRKQVKRTKKFVKRQFGFNLSFKNIEKGVFVRRKGQTKRSGKMEPSTKAHSRVGSNKFLEDVELFVKKMKQ